MGDGIWDEGLSSFSFCVVYYYSTAYLSVVGQRALER